MVINKWIKYKKIIIDYKYNYLNYKNLILIYKQNYKIDKVFKIN